MYDHPMVPGPSSAIEKGPWHYGADYVAVYFDGDGAKLQELLPDAFKVVDGSCIAYVCEIVSVAEGGGEMVASEPERTLYREAAVGVRCSHGPRQGVFYPVMWVTSEWSLLRGLLNGYQKRLADSIGLTRLHPLNPGLKPIGRGTSFGGRCVKGGVSTLSVSVTLEREGSPTDLPAFGATFGLRRFPRTDPSQSSVDEPVEILKSNSKASDVWLGTGSLETVLEVGDPVVKGGAVYRSGFTILGSKVLEP